MTKRDASANLNELHDAFNKAMANMRRLIGYGLIDHTTVSEANTMATKSWNSVPGLSWVLNEVNRIIRRAIAKRITAGIPLTSVVARKILMDGVYVLYEEAYKIGNGKGISKMMDALDLHQLVLKLEEANVMWRSRPRWTQDRLIQEGIRIAASEDLLPTQKRWLAAADAVRMMRAELKLDQINAARSSRPAESQAIQASA